MTKVSFRRAFKMIKHFVRDSYNSMLFNKGQKNEFFSFNLQNILFSILYVELSQSSKFGYSSEIAFFLTIPNEAIDLVV